MRGATGDGTSVEELLRGLRQLARMSHGSGAAPRARLIRLPKHTRRTTIVKRISILFVGLLAIGLVACSSDQAASSSASASVEPPAPATDEATPQASESAEPSGSAGAEESETAGLPSAMPSLGIHADPELEDRLPDTIGGESVNKYSIGGELIEMGQAAAEGDPSFQAFLDAFGAEASDISVAVAAPTSASEDNPISVTAFRVRGASESDLREQFLSSIEDEGEVSGFDDATLAGKDVLVAEDPTGELGGISFYLYTRDDTIYWITGTEELVTEILEALP